MNGWRKSAWISLKATIGFSDLFIWVERGEISFYDGTKQTNYEDIIRTLKCPIHKGTFQQSND